MRLQNAWNYRKDTVDTSSCRLVFGEADFLPGIVIDKYEDVLVMECLTLGMERYKEQLADLMKQTPVTEADFRMLKGKILLILPKQDFFSEKMQKDLIQLMHDPAIQYVSGGHLSTILKADDYVKVIRDFLGNI